MEKKYELFDKTNNEVFGTYATKKEVLNELETIYWYDFDDDNYTTITEFHLSMTIDKALELYKEEWEVREINKNEDLVAYSGIINELKNK